MDSNILLTAIERETIHHFKKKNRINFCNNCPWYCTFAHFYMLTFIHFYTHYTPFAVIQTKQSKYCKNRKTDKENAGLLDLTISLCY